MSVALLGIVLAAASGLVLLLAGPGYRSGLLGLGTAFGLLRWAAYGGLAGAGLSLLGYLLRRRRLPLALAGLVIGCGVAYVPWHWRQRAREVPAIHDITTDTRNPPEFRAVLPLRADAPNSAEYGGPEIAKQQEAAYPDVRPAHLDVPPAAAFRRALEAARKMGWKIVAADSAEDRIEATATTRWFGFKDDVVVRVTPEDRGSRVDVRSESRVGRSDVGTNARRIREYLAELRS